MAWVRKGYDALQSCPLKFDNRVAPKLVAMLSGWNCTPYRGSSLCARPMRMSAWCCCTPVEPKLVHALAGRTALVGPVVQAMATSALGRLASSTTREWYLTTGYLSPAGSVIASCSCVMPKATDALQCRGKQGTEWCCLRCFGLLACAGKSMHRPLGPPEGMPAKS